MGSFDYFYSANAEQYVFYRVPKVLFTLDYFKKMSCEAKLLYGLMLDRMSLSRKKQWIDEDDRVYIVFSIEEITELLGCANQKAVKLSAELTNIGLIEKKRLGFGKPSVIYVKNFAQMDGEDPGDTYSKEGNIIRQDNEADEKWEPYEEADLISQATAQEPVQETQENPGVSNKCENHTSNKCENHIFNKCENHISNKCENHTSRNVKITLQEVWKSHSSNTDINNTEYSKTDNIQENNNIQESIYPSIHQKKKNLPADGIDGKMMDHNDYPSKQEIKEQIRERINYDLFRFRDRQSLRRVDEIISLMSDTLVLSPDGKLRIGSTQIEIADVQQRYLSLGYDHIDYVLQSLDEASKTQKIRNIRRYLATALYNAPSTIDHYYSNRAIYDMNHPDPKGG